MWIINKILEKKGKFSILFHKNTFFNRLLFLKTKAEIIKNPMSNPYSELIYPIIFKANDTSYNIISNRTIYSFVIITSQNNFSLTSEDFVCSFPNILCIDEWNILATK